MMIPYHILYHYIKLSFFVYWYMQVLRAPSLYRGPDRPVVSDARMRGIWTRLRDRSSSLDSSLTMVEVTSAYATHFIDMYVDKHTGKHMIGERVRVRILLLTLPFLLRDLIAPEVCSTLFWFDILMMLHDIVSYIM